MEFVLVGNPGNRRVEAFQKALLGLGLNPAQLVPYLDLLAGRTMLSEVVRAGAIVRIESPERDFEVEKAILALGAEIDDEAAGSQRFACCSRKAVASLHFDKGELLFPRQWFLGYRALLRQIHAQLVACPSHALMNHPEDIEVMFDKPACHTLLAANNVAVPTALGPISSYEELLSRMRQTGCYRVFIKLAHGSSASGVVAYQISGSRHQATTTVEMVATSSEPKLYNSKRLQIYREPGEIARLVDALCRHRVHVEQWLPKAGFQNQTFDLRVVVIGGQLCHVVVRLSHSPITNLHLSNRRASLETLHGQFDPPKWYAAQKTCLEVMKLFPRSLYAGLDLLITSGYRQHAIAEVNAFGDLLYDTFYLGKDTYTTEIETAINRVTKGS